MIKLIPVAELPQTKFFRGRPTSKLRTLPEFEKAMHAVLNNLIPEGRALKIILDPSSIAEIGDTKNVETRFMQLLIQEMKKGNYPYVVRKRTVEKGERPHLYLVHKTSTSQSQDDFDEVLETATKKQKHSAAAA